MTNVQPVPLCCVSAVSLDSLFRIVAKLCPPTGSSIKVTLHNRGHENAGGSYDFFTADVEAAPGVVGVEQCLQAKGFAEDLNRQGHHSHNGVEQSSGIVWKLPKNGV